MKILYKFLIILLNLCILISGIILPALAIASSEGYYSAEFEKNGIYSYTDNSGNPHTTTIYYVDGNFRNQAVFTNEQLDALSKHIIDYLFGETESFYLEMDGVLLNGKITDNVSVFGNAAVTHMEDVKVLMRTALIFAVIAAVIAVGLIVFFIIKRSEVAPYLVRYSLVFFAILIILALIFCVWTLCDLGGFVQISRFPDQAWTNIHHLLFPFQPEKFEGSFFNDTLTQILTLELFLDAVFIVLSCVIFLYAAWFVLAFFIKKSKYP